MGNWKEKQCIMLSLTKKADTECNCCLNSLRKKTEGSTHEEKRYLS